ncbi:MAG: hypothetical protein HUJ22_02525 [Gracilimonas sp.]|uniref:hypothetical protein n=1 Tax=Gracilimonas sp. TaxID=1974203 RepID=UPI0019910209|nr:hypothetical protein [Gracilimonas sp.]MBD3615420.1 hypothetical protein [Gracilimonas sp.]
MFKLFCKYLNIKSIQTVILICFLAVFITKTGNARQNSTSTDSSHYQFWYSDLDARSTALANAVIADPITVSGLYSNPALIALNTLSTKAMINSIYNKSKNIAVENITVPVKLAPNKNMIIGATFHHQVKPDSRLSDYSSLYFNQYTLDVGYGQSLIEDVYVGLNIRSYMGVTESTTTWSGDASLGIVYTPSPLVSYGAVYRGTGYQNHRIGHGIIYYRTVNDDITRMETVKLPQRLEIGATLRFPSIREYPNFVLSFSNEKLFGEEGLVYRGGLEVYIKDIFRLRGGYFHSIPIQGSRIGFGLLLDPVKVDYTFSINNLDRSGQTHQMSISLNF